MQAWEEKYYEREEGREEGKKFTLLDLIIKKLRKGKVFCNGANVTNSLHIFFQFICNNFRSFAFSEFFDDKIKGETYETKFLSPTKKLE